MTLFDRIEEMRLSSYTDYRLSGDETSEDYLTLERNGGVDNPLINRLSEMLYLWTRVNGYYPVDLEYYHYLSGKKRVWLMAEMAKHMEVYAFPETYIEDEFGENVEKMYESTYLFGVHKKTKEDLKHLEEIAKSNSEYTKNETPGYGTIFTDTVLHDLVYFQNHQEDTVAFRINPILEWKNMEIDDPEWIIVFHPSELKSVLTDKTLYERAKDGSKDAQRFGTSFMLSKETERKDIGAFEIWFQIYMLASNETAKSLSEKTGIDVKFFNDIMYNRTTLSGSDNMKAFIKDLPFKTANILADTLGISMSQLYELGELEAKQIK